MAPPEPLVITALKPTAGTARALCREDRMTYSRAEQDQRDRAAFQFDFLAIEFNQFQSNQVGEIVQIGHVEMDI